MNPKNYQPFLLLPLVSKIIEKINTFKLNTIIIRKILSACISQALEQTIQHEVVIFLHLFFSLELLLLFCIGKIFLSLSLSLSLFNSWYCSSFSCSFSFTVLPNRYVASVVWHSPVCMCCLVCVHTTWLHLKILIFYTLPNEQLHHLYHVLPYVVLFLCKHFIFCDHMTVFSLSLLNLHRSYILSCVAVLSWWQDVNVFIQYSCSPFGPGAFQFFTCCNCFLNLSVVIVMFSCFAAPLSCFSTFFNYFASSLCVTGWFHIMLKNFALS